MTLVSIIFIFLLFRTVVIAIVFHRDFILFFDASMFINISSDVIVVVNLFLDSAITEELSLLQLLCCPAAVDCSCLASCSCCSLRILVRMKSFAATAAAHAWIALTDGAAPVAAAPGIAMFGRCGWRAGGREDRVAAAAAAAVSVAVVAGGGGGGLGEPWP